MYKYFHTHEYRKFFESLHIFVKFMGRTFYKVLWCFDRFSLTDEVEKFWNIKLYLHEKDVIYVNKHTYFANLGLYV